MSLSWRRSVGEWRVMRYAFALVLVLSALRVQSAPLPSEVGLEASDPVGESANGSPLLPSLDLKSVAVTASAESTVRLTVETAGSLETPATGSFTKSLAYVFSLDLDNDGFTGTDWGADWSAVLSYDIAQKEWKCDFERHSEAYSRRMRITAKVSEPEGNKISVDIYSALFLAAVGGVWGMETRGDGQPADVIAPDRQKPARIAKGESPAYDDPGRQQVFYDNLPGGGTVSRPFQVPEAFASIKCRLHLREFYAVEGASPEVVFFFGSKPEDGKPFFGVKPKGNSAAAQIGLRGAPKLEELDLGKDQPAFGRDLALRLERKGAWLAFFIDDQLVGSFNAKGLISNPSLLTMQVTSADLRADQFEFAAEEKKEEE